MSSPTDDPTRRVEQRKISDHELLGPIASGSYGEVWLARSAVGTLRAVKMVRRDRFERAAEFEREFKGLQRFEPVSRGHAGLVDILQIGRNEAEGYFYYVMELADACGRKKEEGRVLKTDDERSAASVPSPTNLPFGLADYSPLTLRAHLRARGALPADEVIALGLALTAALAHLHEQGLVHRDIKPSNILFVGGVPKLADAGLVAAMDDARSLVGTAGYIAPEGPGSPQADLYALGKVLYESAFGKDRQEFPQLPSDLAARPDHARLLELNAVIALACAHDPQRRYADAKAMHPDIQRLSQGGSVRRRIVQKRVLRCVAVGASIALALAGVWVLLEPARWRAIPGRGTEGEWSRWTTNRLAWDTYVRAGNIGNNLTRSTHTNALLEYERSIALDPDFSYARAELALQLVCNNYGGMPAEPALARAKSEARRALERDPSLSRAWQALAIAARAEHDLVLAEKHHRRAIQTDPEEFFGHLNFAGFLIGCGRLAEARGELEIARRYDATWPHTDLFLGMIEMLTGHLEEAIRFMDAGILLQANRASGYFARGDVRWEQGRREEAAADWLHGLRLSDVDEIELASMQNAFRTAGSAHFVRAYIEWLERRLALGDHGGHFALAKEYARMGQRGEALDHLNRSLERLEADVLWANVSPEFRGLREDPRFQDFLQRLGLPRR